MLRVIAVDDEAPIRQWLEFCIRRIDWMELVGVAANALEGIALCAEKQPDVIITDIRMPGMDGLKMLGELSKATAGLYMVVLTSHDDFSYARQALHVGAKEYLLKTEINEDILKAVLEKACQDLYGDAPKNIERSFKEYHNRNHFFATLIQHPEVPIGDETLSIYAHQIENGGIVAVAISSEDGEKHMENPPDVDGLINTIKFSYDENYLMLVGNLAEGLKIQDLFTSIGMLSAASGLIYGISEVGEHKSALGHALRQAYLRCSQGFYDQEQKVFFKEKSKEDVPQNYERMQLCFHKALLNQQYSAALTMQKEMQTQIKIQRPANQEQVKKLYLFFITLWIHFTMDDMDKAEKAAMWANEGVASAKTLDQLDVLMNEISQPFQSIAVNMASMPTAISSAIGYINKNFASPIALADISAKCYLSPEYFSRLFKEKTGINFIVYLNNVRMKNAVHLLETTNLKVYEIAEMVGYSNLSYFSTLFKKNIGKNPFEFKNAAEKLISSIE